MRTIWTNFILLAAIFIFADTTSATITINSIDVEEYPVMKVVFTGPKDLQAHDITIQEHRQSSYHAQGPVDDFSSSIIQSTKPLALVLVIDVSGSMGMEYGYTTILGRAKEAARGLIDKLKTGDMVAVISFNDNVTEEPFSPNLTNTKYYTINPLSAEGGTALYDGMLRGIEIAV